LTPFIISLFTMHVALCGGACTYLKGRPWHRLTGHCLPRPRRPHLCARRKDVCSREHVPFSTMGRCRVCEKLSATLGHQERELPNFS
jgi:hypothetical protein